VTEFVARPGDLPLVGSELAFDFTNTESGRASDHHLEHFRAPADVIVWARHAKVMTDRDRDKALAAISRDTALGKRLLTEARALRDLIHRMGAAVSNGKKPDADDLDELVAVHTRMLAHGKLVPFGEAFAWSWDPSDGLIEAVLGPVTLSALTVLTQQDLSRIKQCPGDHCGWLFFDTTKNKSRRWCEMEVCGNRAKQKGFAERRRKTGKTKRPEKPA